MSAAIMITFGELLITIFVDISSAWRKERMVYTAKLLIFTSMANEVVDVIPMAEIVAVNVAADEKGTRRGSVFEELDDESDGGTGEWSRMSKASSKAAQEAAILTEPEGYNSGRTYRV
jgi:hypothetical protein